MKNMKVREDIDWNEYTGIELGVGNYIATVDIVGIEDDSIDFFCTDVEENYGIEYQRFDIDQLKEDVVEFCIDAGLIGYQE